MFNFEEVIPIEERPLSDEEREQISKRTLIQSCRDEDGEKYTCSICCCDVVAGDEVKELPVCTHMFHSNCIDDWLKVKPRCPNCNFNLKRHFSRARR